PDALALATYGDDRERIAAALASVA
ncbi:MAG: hypothetical protein QOE63_736, partial [Acidimicrobiaceae bacterium]